MHIVLPKLSLYIHIPWCTRRCPYCDFNSHVRRTKVPEDEYINALLEDFSLDLARYRLSRGERQLHSIFIGGGTPSLFSAEGITHLLQGVQDRIPFEANIEITMEANPGSAEAARFAQYRRAKVNRISIGIQSFEPAKLKKLGRVHGRREAIYAALLAHKIGLSNFNLDIMYGLPDQSLSQALADLDLVIDLEPPHMSWYQLTLEPNTPFYSNPPTLPDDDNLWDIFQQGHEKLTNAGYVQYEVSSYSKASRYRCHHNLNYWHFGDYLGIGCGSHSKISFSDGRIIRSTKTRLPERYLNRPRQYLDREKDITEEERPFEFFMNRFRLLEACPKREFMEKTGLSLDSIQNAIDDAVNEKYLYETEKSWVPTYKGKLFLNDLLANFIKKRGGQL